MCGKALDMGSQLDFHFFPISFILELYDSMESVIGKSASTMCS